VACWPGSTRLRDIGVKLPIGTALVFDVGVYLVVIGTITAMVFALVAED
jgi:hypothetical protein